MANQKRFMAQKGLDNNNNTIVNVSTPANASDAATKGYVDSSASSTLTSANTYTDGKVSALVAAAPAALDTLNELATALGNDANFATTVTNSIATKLAVADFATTFDTRLGTKTTSNLTEGTNLYYTDARARTAVSAGTGISYNSTTGAISSTITQYTDALARAAVSVSGSLSYNSTTGVISYTTPTTSGITEGTNLYFTNARASAAAPVQSVAGRTGAVTLAVADISGAASTTYVDNKVSALVAAAPAALDTLNELATALGNDANFATTVTNNLAGKASTTGSNASGTWPISVTGSAASATTLSAKGNYVWSASTLPTSYSNGIESSFVSAAQGFQNYGSVMTMNTYTSGGGALQLYVPYSPTYGGTGLQARFGNYDVSGGNSWTAWKTLLASDNYNSYAPTLTGTGASGTWGINITGNAASANTASLAGQVTVNYNNDSNSTYQMLWGSGNSVYGTSGIYCNPSSDYLYASSFSCGNWFRSSGATGWYNESYAVGIYATEAGNVRTYNNASFITNNVTATGVMSSASGYQTTAYASGARNRIWSFGNADGYGLSYFQGTSGRGGSDSIGFHFGTASDAASQFVMQSNGTFIATGELTAYSDAKVKTNVKTIENALDIVTKMRGVTFDRIQDGKASVGVIAQEVKEVLPQVVNYDEQADIHSVAYGNIVGVLIEAIKAQQVQIAELSAEVAKLNK